MIARAVRALTRRAVRDVMRHEMVTAVPEMTVCELAQMLLETGVHSAPVLGPTGRLVGVATLAQVTRLVLDGTIAPCAEPAAPGKADASGASPPPVDRVGCPPGVECMRVREIMGPVGLTVSPGEPLMGLIRRFVETRAQRALVVENDILVGLVTAVDVLNVIDGTL